MEIHKYVDENVSIYEKLIIFIDDEEETEVNYQNFFQIFNLTNQLEKKDKYQTLLRIINKIVKNHHKSLNFLVKIEKIIVQIKEDIKQLFLNSELFGLFKNCRQILLLLIKNNLFSIDNHICKIILDKYFAGDKNYFYYFYPEIKNFLTSAQDEEIKKRVIKDDISTFMEKREIGENESYVCTLIRNDSVEEFVEYVNRANLSLMKTIIKPSIYETNSFLIKNKKVTLIEYSAFFGSKQIFQFLEINGVELTPSLWLYVIHGRNPEMVHLLEEKHLNPPNDSFRECLKESIKCHHNEIADYIQSNLIDSEKNVKLKYNETIESFGFRFYNYAYIPTEFENENIFINLIEYKHNALVKLYIETNKIDLNKKIISFSSIFIKFINKQIHRVLSEIISWNSKVIILIKFYIFILNEILINNFLYDLQFYFHVSPIHLAAEVNNQELINFLFSQAYIKINQNEFAECTKLTQIVIPPYVKTISNCAFLRCSSLEEVIFRAPFCIKTIGDLAFKDCTSLKKISIPSSVNYIGHNAFEGCSSLRMIVIPHLVAKILPGTFLECRSLKHVVFPPTVKSIGDFAFNKCSSLEEIKIPDSVSSIGEQCFSECTSLKNVNINRSNTIIGKMAFYLTLT